MYINVFIERSIKRESWDCKLNSVFDLLLQAREPNILRIKNLLKSYRRESYI